jgi:hypothetical protein
MIQILFEEAEKPALCIRTAAITAGKITAGLETKFHFKGSLYEENCQFLLLDDDILRSEGHYTFIENQSSKNKRKFDEEGTFF